MFGISFSELTVIAVIALVVVGPQKLPGMLRTMGLWVQKLRKLTTEVRAQTGIDEILREEGIDGVQGLRSLLRGEIAAAKQRGRRDPADDPYAETLVFDLGREHPAEGPDAYHAVPDDLLDTDEITKSADATAAGDAADPSVGEPAASTVSEPAIPPVSEVTAPSVSEPAASTVSEPAIPPVSEVTAPSVSEVNAPSVSEANAPPVTEATAPSVSEANAPKNPSSAPPPFSATTPEASHSTTGKPS